MWGLVTLLPKPEKPASAVTVGTKFTTWLRMSQKAFITTEEVRRHWSPHMAAGAMHVLRGGTAGRKPASQAWVVFAQFCRFAQSRSASGLACVFV